MKFMWEVLWFPLLALGGALGFMVGLLWAGFQTAWVGLLVGIASSQVLQCWYWGTARPYYWWFKK